MSNRKVIKSKYLNDIDGLNMVYSAELIKVTTEPEDGFFPFLGRKTETLVSFGCGALQINKAEAKAFYKVLFQMVGNKGNRDRNGVQLSAIQLLERARIIVDELEQA